eukprot:530256-Pyramimonas_sp.AAC.1
MSGVERQCLEQVQQIGSSIAWIQEVHPDELQLRSFLECVHGSVKIKSFFCSDPQMDRRSGDVAFLPPRLAAVDGRPVASLRARL